MPSFFGVWSFLVPFSIQGETNTLIGHVKEFFLDKLQAHLGVAVVAMCFFVVFSSIMAISLKPKWIMADEHLYESLVGEPFWLLVRCLSLPIAMFVVWGDYTTFGVFLKCAVMVVNHLAARLLILSIILALAAPLLLDFGLVQFVSVFMSPIMRPLFKLPGRSCIDCIASWLGSSSMAVVITAKMHKGKHYSDREAAVMVASFSLAGVYNIYAVTTLLMMSHAFLHILFSTYLCMFLLAIILPRIWPLRSIPDSYIDGSPREQMPHDPLRHGTSLVRRAFIHGMDKARHMTVKSYLKESIWILVPLIYSTIPLIITVGTTLLLAAELTPIVKVLATPITSVLQGMGVIEAVRLGDSVVLAFVDHYIAIVTGLILQTQKARFLCICLTTAGLINLTEVGLHVWHSTIPFKFWQMGVIYFMRVTLSLIVLVPLAELFFG